MRRWRIGVVVGIVLTVGSILLAAQISNRNTEAEEYEPLAVSDEVRARYERKDRELADLGATGAALRYDQPELIILFSAGNHRNPRSWC